jgi:hypothetical protein
MNFDEQLMEILNKYMSSNLSADPRLWFDTSTTHKAIKKLIRESVPEGKDGGVICTWLNDLRETEIWCDGFNQCRSELLERLGEGK